MNCEFSTSKLSRSRTQQNTSSRIRKVEQEFHQDIEQSDQAWSPRLERNSEGTAPLSSFQVPELILGSLKILFFHLFYFRSCKVIPFIFVILKFHIYALELVYFHPELETCNLETHILQFQKILNCLVDDFLPFTLFYFFGSQNYLDIDLLDQFFRFVPPIFCFAFLALLSGRNVNFLIPNASTEF